MSLRLKRPRSKYNARRTTVDGIRFASQREATRYSELKMLEKAGQIRDLELQPKYPIEVRGKKVCTYVADFRYLEIQWRGKEWVPMRWVVEDSKGMPTPAYKLKKKLVEALYGITVTEV